MKMTTRLGVTRTLAFLALLLCCGSVMAGDHLVPSTTDTQNVNWFDDGTDTGGKSHLTRTDGMILITLEAAGLVPGDAHTLWWIVFNDPGECSAPGCGEDDIFNPDGSLNESGVEDAEIAIGNASGNVAKSDGTLEFGGRMPRNGDNGHQVLFGAGFASDFLLTAWPHDAEVHVIVQSHGQARGGEKLREQLTYVDTNCSPECADIQFSVHLP